MSEAIQLLQGEVPRVWKTAIQRGTKVSGGYTGTKRELAGEKKRLSDTKEVTDQCRPETMHSHREQLCSCPQESSEINNLSAHREMRSDLDRENHVHSEAAQRAGATVPPEIPSVSGK